MLDIKKVKSTNNVEVVGILSELNIEEKITIELLNKKNIDIEKIKELKNIDSVKLNMNTLVLTYKKGKNNLGEITKYLENNNVSYSKIFSERPTLNDVFLELTGKDLRD